MKKTIKKSLITTLSVATLGLATAAIGAVTNVKTAVAESPSFYVEGADVKYAATDAEMGIRFRMLMENSKYESVAVEGNKIGMLFMPSDKLSDKNADGVIDENDFNLGTADVENGVTYADGVSEWTASEDYDGYMESYVYIYDIPYASANRPVSVIGYIDGATDEYTAVYERSMAGVAYEAVQEGADASLVGQYLSQEYTVKFLDTEGNEISSTAYTYGKQFTVPSYTLNSETEVFNGWKKRVGTNNGEAVWTDGAYNMNAENAKFVAGNMQFVVNTKPANVFETFDYDFDGMGFCPETAGTSSTITKSGTWLSEYEGEKGVIKLDFNAGSDYNYLRVYGMDSAIMQKAVNAKFDYIRVRMYLDPLQNDTTGKTYQWRSHNTTHFNKINPKQWIDYDMQVSEMQNTWLTYSMADKSDDSIRAKLQSTLATVNWNRFGYVDGGLTSAYTLYISEISWGVNESNPIATFNADKDGLSFYTDSNSLATWMDSYEGEQGVMKLTLPQASATEGAKYLRMNLGTTAINNAIAGNVDYIRFRMYLDPLTNNLSSYQMRSYSATLGEITPNTWVNFDINLRDLSKSWLTSNQEKTITEIRTALSAWGPNISAIMFLYNSTASYDVYIDEISWGVEPNTFEAFDNSKDGMGFGGCTASTWMDNYAGEQGVVKLDFNAGNDSNYLTINNLNSRVMQEAVAGEFDYIRIRIYLDPLANDTTGKTYQLRSWNSQYGEITPNQWVDYDIKLTDMTNSWIVYTDSAADKTTEAAMRSRIQATWASINLNRLGYVDGGLTSAYSLYISSISWGVYEA